MLKYEEPALKDAVGILVAYTNTGYTYAQSMLIDNSLRNIIYQFDKANNGTLNIDVETFSHLLAFRGLSMNEQL